MRTVGIIGLGKNYEKSVGYKLGQLIFQRSLDEKILSTLLVNSRKSSTIDAFFEHGIKEVLEQNIGCFALEERFDYSRLRSSSSVEDIVRVAVRRADYKTIAEQSDALIVCLEASVSTVDITPELARQQDFRRNLYRHNAEELSKILPYFRNYAGMVFMVTNPPGWLCLDVLEKTRIAHERIVGIHPETHRLRDFRGLFTYLQKQGLEVYSLEGINAIYVLGDHGGANMTIPLSPAKILGRVSARFDPRKVKEGIKTYVNYLANQTLLQRGSTSHEVAALVSRMVTSLFNNDGEEYVMGVYANHLGPDKVVFSGEPSVFHNGRAVPRPLSAFLPTLEERTEYVACLQRMHEAASQRHVAASRVENKTRSSEISSLKEFSDEALFLRVAEEKCSGLFKVPMFLSPSITADV